MEKACSDVVGVPKELVPGTCIVVIGWSEIGRRTKGIGRRVIRTRSAVSIDTIDNVNNNETDRAPRSLPCWSWLKMFTRSDWASNDQSLEWFYLTTAGLATTSRLLFPTHSPTRPANPTRSWILNMNIMLDQNTGYDHRTNIHQNLMHIVKRIIVLIDEWDSVALYGVKQHSHPVQTVGMVNWEQMERECTKNAERAHPERPEKVWYVHFWWTAISGPLYLEMNECPYVFKGN